MFTYEIWTTLDIENRRKRWERLTAENTSTSPYHAFEWSELLATVYGWKPCHVVAVNQKEVVGLLPAFLCSSILGQKKIQALPFSHLTPPLVKNKTISPDLVSRLVEHARSCRAKSITLHTAPESLGGDFYKIPNKHWSRFAGRQVSILSLEDYRKQGNKLFSSSAKRNFKKAQKSGVSVIEESSIEAFEELYKMLLATRKRQGVPPYPHKLMKELAQSSNVRLFFAMQGTTPVAGVVLLTWGKKAIYLYGASFSKAFPIRANDYLFSSLINSLAAEGYTELDFGSTPDWHTDLLRFKNKWGCVSSPLEYSIWSERSRIQGSGKDLRSSPLGMVASYFIRKTPVRVLAWFGNHFFKFLV